eukprot:5804036-Alexandrium_andersonii.AAC.1
MRRRGRSAIAGPRSMDRSIAPKCDCLVLVVGAGLRGCGGDPSGSASATPPPPPRRRLAHG